jgi:DNA (cytosine-5)-methyltransferase 1
LTDIKIRDDFAGPGGWDQGLREAAEEAGIILPRSVGVEFEADACATAEAAGHERLQMDVRRLDPLEFLMLVLYLASPPCQTFSQGGNGEGRKHLGSLALALKWVAAGVSPQGAIEDVQDEALDQRSVLALEPMRVISAARPPVVALEQVPTVLPLWKAYAEIMGGDLDYLVRTEVMYAEQYGVPQTRRRAVLVAVRRDVAEHHGLTEVPWATPTHSRYYSHSPAKLDPGVEKWITMAEALGYGMDARPSMTVTGGGTATGGAEPFGGAARRGMLKEMEEGRWKYPTVEVPGDTSWVYNRPSPTMVSSFRPDVVAAPGYRKAGDPPRQKTPGSVRITPQEAAILQTFPVDYPWKGKSGSVHQQIGNAVPPRMAGAVLKPLLPLL